MVILFDGVCNLCNAIVRFIIKRDKKNIFKFASLQSQYGRELLERFHIQSTVPETIILFDGQKIYLESDAVIKILSLLGGIWKVFSIFTIVPKVLRNGLYKAIAKSRYSVFGKRDECMVPAGDIKERFIDN